MKFASKKALLDQIESEHETFVELAASIPARRYREEGVWGDGWTIKDLFAHLTEWEQMFLQWYRQGRDGHVPALPTEGHKWNELPKLNQAIWKKHKTTSWKRVHEAFERSYSEILSLTKSLSERELLTPGYFGWTKKHPLTTYLAPNTCSHYRTATKILKRWLKSQKSAP